MVSHQAVCVSLRNRLDIFDVKLEKIRIVALFDEDIFAVDTAIIDVVIRIIKKARVG